MVGERHDKQIANREPAWEMATLACVATAWEPGAAGMLRLPSGRLARGRALRGRVPAGAAPQFALYLRWRQPPPVPWEGLLDPLAGLPRSVEIPWQRRFVAGFR
jgi:hypothetical protein